jgi:hypothetical protein
MFLWCPFDIFVSVRTMKAGLRGEEWQHGQIELFGPTRPETFDLLTLLCSWNSTAG